MMLAKTFSAALLCAGFAITMISCSSEPKDSKEAAEEMNEDKFNKEGEKTADKLVHAYSANLYEIKASENALMNASSPEVKRLAGMLVEAHTKMNENVKSMAAAKEVTLPTDLSDDQRKDLEKLTEKSGLDYDEAYTDQMKDKHEKALDFYEKTAKKSDDADIQSWASNTVAEVRSHLDMVKSSCEIVKDRKKHQ
jgi:putative membrane protein